MKKAGIILAASGAILLSEPSTEQSTQWTILQPHGSRVGVIEKGIGDRLIIRPLPGSKQPSLEWKELKITPAIGGQRWIIEQR